MNNCHICGKPLTNMRGEHMAVCITVVNTCGASVDVEYQYLYCGKCRAIKRKLMLAIHGISATEI